MGDDRFEKVEKELQGKMSAAGREARLSHQALLVGNVIVGLIFAVFCAFIPSLSPLIWVPVTLAFVGAIAYLTKRQLAAPLVVETIGELNALRAALAGERRRAEYGSEFIVVASVLLKFIETRIEQGIGDDSALNECLDEALEVLESAASALFSFSPGEKWSVTVYRAAADRTLVPEKRVASHNHPRRIATPRTWRAGEGHVGQAFQRSEIIVTEDSTDPKVANFIRPPEGNFRDYDDRIYRSYVSAPIGQSARGKGPLGVLVVTSDMPRRFSESARKPVEFFAAALAAILRIRYQSVVSSQRGKQ